MGIQLAISVERDHLMIVAAHSAPGGLLTVDSVQSIDSPVELPGDSGSVNGSHSADGEANEGEDPADAASAAVDKNGAAPIQNLSTLFPGQEIDSVVAVIPSDPVLYHRVMFPFSDPKKVEAVSLFQLQDLVPFDLDGYVIENLRLSGSTGGTFPHLASLVPEEVVQNSLSRLTRIGADPKVISTKPSAIVGMLPLFKAEALDNGALVLLTAAEAALSIFIDGRLYALRNLSGYLAAPVENADGSSTIDLRQVLPHIISTLTAAEEETGRRMTRMLVVGPAWAARELETALNIEVRPLDLSRAIARGDGFSGSFDEIAWAAGLLEGQRSAVSAEAQGPEIINFRTGKYAYRRGLIDLLSALSDEFFYISLVFLMFIVWVASSFYASSRMLSEVDDEISRLLAGAMPGESVPYQREVPFVEDRVQELEDQLKGIGSLSSLSPLESLEELSQSISQTIDVQVDSLSIGHSRITFSGTVPDVPSVGRLESALLQKKSEFCDVKVDPRDKLPGSSRLRFSAEIKLCD